MAPGAGDREGTRRVLEPPLAPPSQSPVVARLLSERRGGGHLPHPQAVPLPVPGIARCPVESKRRKEGRKGPGGGRGGSGEGGMLPGVMEEEGGGLKKKKRKRRKKEKRESPGKVTLQAAGAGSARGAVGWAR